MCKETNEREFNSSVDKANMDNENDINQGCNSTECCSCGCCCCMREGDVEENNNADVKECEPILQDDEEKPKYSLKERLQMYFNDNEKQLATLLICFIPIYITVALIELLVPECVIGFLTMIKLEIAAYDILSLALLTTSVVTILVVCLSSLINFFANHSDNELYKSDMESLYVMAKCASVVLAVMLGLSSAFNMRNASAELSGKETLISRFSLDTEEISTFWEGSEIYKGVVSVAYNTYLEAGVENDADLYNKLKEMHDDTVVTSLNILCEYFNFDTKGSENVKRKILDELKYGFDGSFTKIYDYSSSKKVDKLITTVVIDQAVQNAVKGFSDVIDYKSDKEALYFLKDVVYNKISENRLKATYYDRLVG